MVREGKYGTASGNLNEVLSIRAQESEVWYHSQNRRDQPQ